LPLPPNFVPPPRGDVGQLLRLTRFLTPYRWRIAIALAALVVQTALAVPIGGGGGGGGPPDDDPPIDPTCARRSTGTLTATPASIKLGESVIVSWSVSIPAKCKNPGPLTLNGTPVATEGSITVQPMSNAAYVLLLNGVRLGLAQIAVQLPSTVHIKGGTPPWRDLMIQALGTPNTLVLLAANSLAEESAAESPALAAGA
jgi:hypothetical protein